MFRAGPSHYSTAGAWSESRAGWYAPRQPPQFDKTGAAVWHGDPFASRRGFSAWLSRVFGRRAKRPADLPTAIAPTRSGLPVPSIVYVTNLATFATVKVRVDERGPMGAAVISLSPQAAGPLGAQAGQPLMVRIRYAAPVIAYREPQPARYAFWRSARKETQLAAAPAAPAAVAAPAVPAAAVVAQAPAPAAAPPVLRPAIAVTLPEAFRLQVGAFADPANARRAVVRLAPAGAASIEPVERDGRTLYRVLLPAPVDPRAAEVLRTQAAALGFTGARLVRAS